MKTVNNISPKALYLENLDINEAIKYSLLPAQINNDKVFLTTQKNLIDALNFYNKQPYEYELILTDENSFERVLNKFLETKTKKDFEESSFEEDE